MTHTQIQVRNLSAVYRVPGRNKIGIIGGGKTRSINALNSLDFDLVEGDRVGIIGRNGSGKSTLLKVLSGDMPPAHGALNVVGQRLVLLNRRAGLIANATLRENAQLRAYSFGLAGRKVSEFVENSLLIADLVDRGDDPLNSLSDGMSGRFNLALNSQIIRPIVIVDEWIGALDSLQSSAGGMLDRLRAESEILVLATHDEKLIRRLCNKVIVLNQGKIDYFGSDIDYGYEVFRPKVDAPTRATDIIVESSDVAPKEPIHIMNFGRVGIPHLEQLFQQHDDNNRKVKFHGLHKRLRDLSPERHAIIVYREPVARFVSAYFSRMEQLRQPEMVINKSELELLLFEKYSDINELVERLDATNTAERFFASRAFMSLRLVRQDLSWYFDGITLANLASIKNWRFCNYDNRQALADLVRDELNIDAFAADPNEPIQTPDILSKRSISTLRMWFANDVKLVSFLNQQAYKS